MSFNEFNSVENYIIYQLTGLNPNSGVQEPKEKYGLAWEYQPASSLDRSVNEVLLEPDQILFDRAYEHIKEYY